MNKKTVFILFVFGALACNKVDNTGQREGEKSQRISSTIESCLPDNPANPVDSVGDIHNLALDYVDDNIGLFDSTKCQPAIIYANAWTKSRYPFSNSYITTKSQLEYLMTDITDTMKNYVNSLGVSTTVKGYLKQLFAALIDTNDVSSFCDMKSRIVSIEAQINIDNSLTSMEKKQLFLATSIARHSYYYWSTQAEFNTQYAGKGNTVLGGKFLKWLKAGVTAVADVAGGIGGAVAGAKAASGSGIVSPSLGAAAGAVSGAAATSAGAAGLVDKVVGWFS